MAKLILPTKFGGVPYLNDTFISKIDHKFCVFNFAEFVCNLDIFDKFNEQKGSKTIIKDLFKLNHTVLLFLDSKEQEEKYGSADVNSIFVKSTNGKFKLELNTYIKYLSILSPTYASVPYEHITDDLGVKRIKRNSDKIKNFIKILNEDIRIKTEKGEQLLESKFLIPLFHNNSGFSTPDFADEILLLEQADMLGGSILQLKEYKSYESLTDLKNNIDKISGEIAASFSKEGKEYIHYFNSKTCNPIDILISMMSGSNTIDATYAFDLAETGSCIVSEFSFSSKNSSNIGSNKPSEYNINLIDLKDAVYEADTSVLKDKCKCFTCKTGYTKAYINHLFKCNELNGHILLLIHNCHFLENMIKEFGSIEKSSQWNSFLKYLNSECIPKL